MDFEPNDKLELNVTFDGAKFEVTLTGLWMPKLIHRAQAALSKQYAHERRQIARNFGQSKAKLKEKENELARREAQLKAQKEPNREIPLRETLDNIGITNASLLNERINDGSGQSEQSSRTKSGTGTEQGTEPTDTGGESDAGTTAISDGSDRESSGDSERPGSAKGSGTETAGPRGQRRAKAGKAGN